MVLELNSPFILIEDNGEIFTESLIRLDPEEETNIMLGFKPPIQSNLECATYRDVLTIRYQEHPQKVNNSVSNSIACLLDKNRKFNLQLYSSFLLL